jgi:hypothetical protein
MRPLINIASYNLIWLICVLGGNRWAWIGLALVGCHFLFSSRRIQDGVLAGAFLLAGLVIDGILNALGFFSFRSGGFPIPFWLMTIWLALATLPHHSLAWMKGRHLINALFGAVGGPLAYWGGVRLGAASFNWPLLDSLLILALMWAIFWVLAMMLATVVSTKIHFR